MSTENPANSEAVQAALAYSMKLPLDRFSETNPEAWKILDNWGDRRTESIPYIAAQILGIELKRLQAALAEKEESFWAQRENYLNLTNAIIGDGTFICEVDPTEIVLNLHSKLAAANKRIGELAEIVSAYSGTADALHKAEQERDRYRTALSLVYDGYAVYNAMTQEARNKTRPENVSDVLDAVAKLQKAALATPGDAADHQSTAPEDKGADSCKKNDPVFLTEQQPGDAASLSALYSSFCEDEMSSEQLAAARKKYDDYVQRTLKPQPQAGDAPREL